MGLDEEKVDESCPKDLEPYLKAYSLRLDESNKKMWLQGRYVFDAFQVVLANAFSKTASAEYPKEPYPLFGAKKNIDPEANEKLAMYEFMAYAKALERDGRFSN